MEEYSMKVNIRPILYAVVSAVLAGACGGSSGGDSPTSPTLPPDVEALRASLAPYTSFTLAKNAGYSTAITDCMSNGDQGAMGVHYGNTALIDGTADPMHPEVLIYEPGADGDMALVGVEFIVPFAILPKTATPPTLFGQKFSINDVFGVWALHVWTHRLNPSGTFADWNPRVHC
jgi:hypothetical protein